MSAAKTASERVAKMRKKRSALGMVRKDVYVHPDDWHEIRLLVAKLQRRRSKGL